MPSQRPFFFSTFLAAFRQQPPSSLPSASQQPNKHSAQSSATAGYNTSAASAPRTISSSAASSPPHAASSQPRSGVMNQLPLHSPRSHGGIPIPGQTSAAAAGRRRGSDSSSEGFRDVMGADKWYIGGRTAAGEEKFFKLGVVRRVRSGDRLSLDRLSL